MDANQAVQSMKSTLEVLQKDMEAELDKVKKVEDFNRIYRWLGVVSVLLEVEAAGKSK